jgi:hypothetical protein
MKEESLIEMALTLILAVDYYSMHCSVNKRYDTKQILKDVGLYDVIQDKSASEIIGYVGRNKFILMTAHELGKYIARRYGCSKEEKEIRLILKEILFDRCKL